jgi:hypothetical protein
VEDDPAGDGTRDYTANTGSAGVSVELTAIGDAGLGPQGWLDQLRGLCHPRRRLYMHIKIDDWPEYRRILVRGATAPRNLTAVQPDVQFQWKAPQGWLEAVDEDNAELQATGGVTTGVSFPLSLPFSFPAESGVGGAPFTVGGQAPAWPTFDIYGPCTAPKLTNSFGQVIAFTSGLTVADGHFVRVQPKGQFGPLVADDANVSQYRYLDFAQTSWWPLEPGENRITYTAASLGAGSRVVIRWRSRW